MPPGWVLFGAGRELRASFVPGRLHPLPHSWGLNPGISTSKVGLFFFFSSDSVSSRIISEVVGCFVYVF